MVNYYKTVNDSLLKVNSPEDDTWISLLNPSEDEVNDVAKAYDIDINDMRSALDKDERYYHRTDEQLKQFAGWKPDFEKA